MTDHVAFTDQPAVRFGAATDVGMIRVGNEDAYVCEPMVFGVADGMGGHQAGEVASAIAARIIRERLNTGASNVGVVVAAVVEANAAIYQAAHASVDHHGMGTTLTALVVLRADEANASRFALINVGDSRTYLLRNGELHRATVDHSYVQELVNTGHITEEEARSHPRRNIVTRALGIEPTVRVDTWLVPMVKGDRFILCSDGLVDEVTDEDIGKLATTTDDPDALAQQLVAMANANGGRDNVTVVVVDVLQGVAPTTGGTLESEPAWPEGEATTMIDADAESIFAAPATAAMTVSGPITDQIPATPADPRRRFGPKLLFILLGAAALLTVVITLVAVAVHNGNDNGSTETIPATVPATAPATTPSTSPSTTSTTSTSTSTSTTTSTSVGTSTSGP